jgi:FAD/FMN-containing dehydrogenase
MDRRHFLQAGAASALGLLPHWHSASAAVVNDISALNPINVGDERRPSTTDEVRSALRATQRTVSVGGGRYSMGGQIAAPDSLHLDMRAMKQVVAFDAQRRRIRVQAGMTWRDVQDVIDPHDLSVKIMQSYSNFTVGGSVSVNVHGRYVGYGALVNAVQAVQLVTAGGDVLELTRSREPELFAAVCGGYGGLGVITEVELDIDPNTRIERVVQNVPLELYPAFFQTQVISGAKVLLHNADLIPPHFNAPSAVSWITTDKPLTRQQRLVPRGLNYKLDRNVLWVISELPGGAYLRDGVIAHTMLNRKMVVSRNYEASADAASLEPRSRDYSTYLLQEYFVPVANFLPFVGEMARILKARKVNALNVSIRYSPPDTVSLMKWAPVDVFSFVLYYKQRSTLQADEAAGVWTRELIQAALALGGRYYLPYRLHATRAQFDQAYPEARAFAALKVRASG